LNGPTLAVVLVSSLAWAALDALRKRLAVRVPPAALVALLALGTLPPLVAWQAFEGRTTVEAGYAPPALAALGLNVGANLLFMRALRVAPLSTTIPLLSLTPAGTALFSALLLHEWPGMRALAGVALVVIGAFVLGAPSGGGPRAAVRPRLRDDGPRLMLGVALLWSLVSVADKAALLHAAPAMHAALQCAGVGLAALGLLAFQGRGADLRSVRPVAGTLAAAVAVSALALGLQFFAFQQTYVSSVEAVKRTLGLLASQASGRLFFGEPFTARKWAGALTMALGVVLILG
jgi:drug/metabolite transporter (DMT)-like permease